VIVIHDVRKYTRRMNNTIAMFILLSSCTSILHSNLGVIHQFPVNTVYTVHKHFPLIIYFFFCEIMPSNTSIIRLFFWASTFNFNATTYFRRNKVKVKQPFIGLEWPEGSRKLRFPDFMTTAQKCDKVVSLTHRPPLPSGNTPGTHFC